MVENALSPTTVTILRLIAGGHSYSQIVDGQSGITYLDIFSAAGEALELGEMVSAQRSTTPPDEVPEDAPRDLSGPLPPQAPQVPVEADSNTTSASATNASSTDASSTEVDEEEHSAATVAWTREEDVQLLRLSRAGVSLEGLARTFERRPAEIRSRMTLLGLP